jgi:DNA-binding NarL/FixJ family response regulator
MINESLSSREIEVLKMAAEGNNCRHIARALFISENTCETHRRNILLKLGAKNMTEAVYVAVKRGII